MRRIGIGTGLAAMVAALAACGSDGGGNATATPAAAPTPVATLSSIAVPDFIAAAAKDPARGDMAAVDARRHGPEILAFAGTKPGDKVIDLIPGAAYWTRLFARSVGPQGHVYGIWPEPYARVAKSNVDGYRAMSGSKDWPNVSLGVQPATELTAPEKVDIVFTSQNYHDYPDEFMGKPGTAAFNKAAFAALKPGGTLVILDFERIEGVSRQRILEHVRAGKETVIKEVEAEGFRLTGERKLLQDNYFVTFERK